MYPHGYMRNLVELRYSMEIPDKQTGIYLTVSLRVISLFFLRIVSIHKSHSP